MIDSPYVDSPHGRLERRFAIFHDEMAQIHASKNADYGEKDVDPYANFHRAKRVGVEPWRGALVRMMDKVSRIETFATDGSLKNESFEDSLMDLANYCLIVRSLYHETRESSV